MTTPSHLLQFFTYAHLPAHLQAVSKPFGDLAQQLEATLPINSEKTTALRKLLEAKDCAVRALLFKPVESSTGVLDGSNESPAPSGPGFGFRVSRSGP